MRGLGSKVRDMSVRTTDPGWLTTLFGLPAAEDGNEVLLRDQLFVRRDGIWRCRSVADADQAQTAATFGFKWAKRATFERPEALERVARYLDERYGDVSGASWWSTYGDRPLVVDAGCGAAMSALALLADRLPSIRYLGVDLSDAVDVAAERFAERRLEGAFLQADVCNIPLPQESVDVILSEGVLHHTPSTFGALASLVPLLKRGGRLLFYVYRRKGPVREFTDDYIRGRIQSLAPADAWNAMVPLTRLGQLLGELDIEIDIPESIELLDIPAGPINLQRFFYWHVCKAYYDGALSLDEMIHINFDWFAPAYAHRQSPEEVRSWCGELGLDIEHENVQEAGITIIARRA
jgi:arsenite methyltransferase